jgi:hypothetical protein
VHDDYAGLKAAIDAMAARLRAPVHEGH